MLTETFFTSEDAVKLHTSYKRYRLVSYLFLIIGVPFEVLVAFLLSKGDSIVFWAVAILGLAVLFFAFYSVFFKNLKSFKQDLNEQIKLIGELQVISKSDNKKEQIIGFNSIELDKISLSEGAFSRVNVGDTLFIEVSKYARRFFKILKNGEPIDNTL